MASDRRPGSGAPEDPAAGPIPIPTPEDDDVEDVSWALSTAEASWLRGDPAEALKWLRRAAEGATEATANERAVVLAKAAADLATKLGLASPPPSARPGPPPPGVPPVRVPPNLTNAMHPSRLPMNASSPTSTLASHGNEGRKGRKSANNLEREAKAAKPSSGPAGGSPPRSTGRPPKPSADVRRRRSSRPPPTEVSDSPIETLPRPPSISDAIDAWPTQSMEGEELSNLTDKMTRAAVFPIYPVPRAAPATMQAVRVIVWQAPEGVRVAPVGTPVAAPAVEALLVALDPKADLAAWLSRR